MLLPPSVPFPGTGLHQARASSDRELLGQPLALSACLLRGWRCPGPNGAQPGLSQHPTGISHRLPPLQDHLPPGKTDLQQTTLMKQQASGKTYQLWSGRHVQCWARPKRLLTSMERLDEMTS
jgi:hypothetical protein